LELINENQQLSVYSSIESNCCCGRVGGSRILHEYWRNLPQVYIPIRQNFPRLGRYFFVISGFIIFNSAINISSNDRLFGVHFLIKRLLRIFPSYWLVLLAAISISGSVKFSGPDFPMANLISLFILTTTANWYIPPAWSLSFELYFYVIISCLLISSPKNIKKTIVAWLIIQFILGLIYTGIEIHTNALITEFSLGVFISIILQEGKKSGALLPALLSLAAFAIGYYCAAPIPVEGWLRVATYGVGGALLVWAALMYEKNNFTVPSTLVIFGNFSYSIYVAHFLFLKIFEKYSLEFGIFDLAGPKYSYLVVLSWILMTIFLSYLLYRYIDNPIQIFSKRFLKRIFKDHQTNSARERSQTRSATLL
jgi:exopolysaccharide production protein ExoZ